MLDNQDSRYTRVSYTAPDGTPITLRRKVPKRFDSQFKVGDTVTVDYVDGDPRTGRIRDWDLDSRQWLILFIMIPMGWVSFVGACAGLKSLFSPYRELETWSTAEADGKWIVMTSTSDLETYAALWPERHRDTTGVFFNLERIDPKENYDDISPYKSQLEKAGIDCKLIADTYLILGPDSMNRLCDRLGRKATIKADYCQLRGVNTSEAETWTLKLLPAQDDNAPLLWLADTEILSRDRMVGRFPQNELPVAFDNWTRLQLERLHDGDPPEGLLDANFSKLFIYSVGASTRQLLFERRRHSTRIYCEQTEQVGVMMAEYRKGAWAVLPDVPKPKAMRSFNCLGKITLVLLGPLVLIVLFAHACVWPVTYLMNRSRMKKLQAARASVLGDDGQDN